MKDLHIKLDNGYWQELLRIKEVYGGNTTELIGVCINVIYNYIANNDHLTYVLNNLNEERLEEMVMEEVQRVFMNTLDALH